ncbi:HWE histidine kinase domain-containing protein [Jannaschia formosa]|uniref:HWE histidine kinase domain-containing protein n=1 Tax=Jannaschia formosa TaxID=2259592 RepID=UPI001074DC27|nr:HWE histidine kinase domain-containing protein [Jannaschia formosa]TFL17413.1 GAF domain-containing protein [Jannaschia formosa]
MAVCWGDDFIFLYNQAWAELAGDGHPDALGKPAQDVFAEAWDKIGPVFGNVMAGNGSCRIEDGSLPVGRAAVGGARFSFVMDPIPLEDDAIGGILVTAFETADRVPALRDEQEATAAARDSEQEKSFLLKLSDALRPLSDPVAMQTVAAKLLGRHLGANRVHYGEVRAGTDDEFSVTIHWGYGDGLPPMVGTFHHRAEGWGEQLLASYRAGRTAVCHDIDADPTIRSEEAAVIGGAGFRGYVTVPLVKQGTWVAMLSVHSTTPRRWTDSEVALVEETAERTWAAVERARAEAALRESEARYHALFESIDEGFYRARTIFDTDGRCIDIAYDDENPAAVRMTGRSFRGHLLSEMGPYEDYWLEIFGHTARTGEAQRLERHAAPDDRWYDFYVFKPPQSGPQDLAVIFRDVTDQKRSEERQNTLTAELDHRVKNILSVVQSIARQSLGRSEEATRLTGRISALAQSHAMLAANQWEGARFGELVENAVAPYQSDDGTRIALGGPDLKVMPKPAQTLTLALHELVTNAAKYGALSRPEGRVVAEWTLTGEGDDRRLSFRWTERGGPPLEGRPSRSGFGSRLIERTLAYELEGVGTVDFAKEGLQAVFDLPMRNIRVRNAWQPREDPQENAAPPRDPASLAGRRILVAEDEEFVAEETAEALRAAGCTVVGPFPTLARALMAAVSEELDAAVLDVNLGGDLIWPAAMALAARDIPIAFATGYVRDLQAPPQFADAPWIEKPLLPHRLLSAVAGLFPDGSAG